jgi:hypothetical protein
VTGFFVGVGAAAVAYYIYKKNQDQIDEFLRRQGIQIPDYGKKDPANMTLEELVGEKERLEDLIAEHELSGQAPKAKKAAK